MIKIYYQSTFCFSKICWNRLFGAFQPSIFWNPPSMSIWIHLCQLLLDSIPQKIISKTTYSIIRLLKNFLFTTLKVICWLEIIVEFVNLASKILFWISKLVTRKSNILWKSTVKIKYPIFSITSRTISKKWGNK